MRVRTVLSAAVLAAFPMALAAEETAERIYTGGPVLTMNDAMPRAEAVAVGGGKILAVGTADEVMKLKGGATEVIDLQGHALIPGFYDAHGHVTMGGLQAMSANLLAPPDGEVTDIASLQATLRDWMAANPEVLDKVGLVIGFGYDNAMLAEQRHPTREDLDAVTTDYPLVIVHQSGHLGAMNSKALEIVGYGAQTPDPAGGVIRRGPDGAPDGVVEEAAFFSALFPLLGKIGPEGGKALVKAGADLWARYGYTTAEDGRSSAAVTTILRQVGAEGGLKIDVVVYPDVLTDRDFIRANASPDYKDHVRVQGAKLTIDGSPQGFTALRDRPYYDPVGDYPPGYKGYATITQDQVDEAVDWAFANGIQIITHSNGEGASDMLIAAIAAAEAKYGADKARRPVLIHGQFEREDQADSFVKLGVFPSLFPMHTFYWGDWHREHTVGPALADNISPVQWYLKRGSAFSSHHDAPVAFPDSMRVLDATVTRRTRSGDILGPDQRVDAMTGLKAMTIWPAWSHFEETTKGSIEPGKLADLVILSDDPTAVDPETIDQIKVLETIKEGATVYQSTASADGKQGGLAPGLAPAPSGADPFAAFLTQAVLAMPEASGEGCGIDFLMTALEPALTGAAASN